MPAAVNCKGLHDRPNPLSRITPNVIVPQRVTEGAARFLVWRYAYVQEELFADAGGIPLTNTRGVQEQ